MNGIVQRNIFENNQIHFVFFSLSFSPERLCTWISSRETDQYAALIKFIINFCSFVVHNIIAGRQPDVILYLNKIQILWIVVAVIVVGALFCFLSLKSNNFKHHKINFSLFLFFFVIYSNEKIRKKMCSIHMCSVRIPWYLSVLSNARIENRFNVYKHSVIVFIILFIVIIE